MATNEFYYYNKGIPITREEAHALLDKRDLVVADREVNFEVEFLDQVRR